MSATTQPASVAGDTSSRPALRRVLRLQDLVLYGIIVIQPVAPMSVFGVLSERGHGHVVTAVLIAMIAMLFTGISYGNMASVYPNGGSAFTYVARGIHPGAGWVAGWSMLMDFVFNPLICTCWCAQQMNLFFPAVPVWTWKVGFALGFTLLNLRGIQSSARVNAALAAVMGLVVVVIIVAGVAYVTRMPELDAAFFARPFYDPATFELNALFHTTSIAVLTYVGFDGISTLADEAQNPKRNIRLATVLTCLCIGLLAAIEVYLAQLVWPASKPFPNVDTAYVAASAQMWPPLLTIVGVTLLIANVGSGTAAHLGAARLLFAMGRSNALPNGFFGAVHPKTRVPRNNVLLVGGIVLIGSFFLSFSLGVELLNFGALLAFMGVNAAAFLHFFLHAERRSWSKGMPALIGFLVCFGLWLNLSSAAKLYGGLWMTLGLAYGVWRTRWFRRPFSFDDARGE